MDFSKGELIAINPRTVNPLLISFLKMKQPGYHKHDSELGNAPASKLFDLVTVKKNCGDDPTRSFADYTVTVGEAPAGVELLEKI